MRFFTLKELSRKFSLLVGAVILSGLFGAACNENVGNVKPSPDAAKNDLTLRGYKFDENSFHEAIKQSDLRAVNAFIAAGINVNARPGNETPLTAAIEKGDAKIFKALLDGKADPNATNKAGETPLTLALSKPEDKFKGEFVDLLLAANADVNAPGRNNQTPIYLAINARRDEFVKKILERNPNVNTVENENGESPIVAAAVNNDLPAVQELIKRGANVNQQSKSGGSALIYAASYGYADIAQELIKAGAKKDLKDAKGRTALDWAKKNNKNEIIAVLQK